MLSTVVSRFADPVFRVGPKIPGVVLGLIFGYVVIRILEALLQNTLKIARIPKALSNIILSLTAVVLWVILFSELAQEVGMSSLSIKISGSLLIVGLAVANGMSALAGDIVSGVFLAKDKDFEVGMRIKMLDIEGKIEKIDMRKTRLRDDSGKLYIIPNSKIDSTGWSVIEK